MLKMLNRRMNQTEEPKGILKTVGAEPSGIEIKVGGKSVRKPVGSPRQKKPVINEEFHKIMLAKIRLR